MSSGHDRFLELCAAWALGALDAADRQALDAHLAGGCAECEAEMARCADAAALLAAAAPPVAPPAALRARVLDAAGAPRKGRMFSLAPALGWIVAAGLLAVVFMGWQLVTDLSRSLVHEREWNELLQSPAVALAPTPDGAKGLSARVHYDKSTGRALLLFDNYRPPEGRAYELWAIRDKGPESLGLLRPDAEGRFVLRLADAGKAAAFAVSVEPPGGAPKGSGPTGAVVSVGAVG